MEKLLTTLAALTVATPAFAQSFDSSRPLGC